MQETNGHQPPTAQASALTDHSNSWQEEEEEDRSVSSTGSPTTPGNVSVRSRSDLSLMLLLETDMHSWQGGGGNRTATRFFSKPKH